MCNHNKRYATSDNEQDFAHTREQMKSLTSSRITEIRKGSALDILTPYAKVYLGLYLDIDNRNSPKDRVRLLAAPDLAEVIFEGWENLLFHTDLPKPSHIGTQMIQGQNLPVGFAVLAGMHALCESTMEPLSRLSDNNLAAALCFHYSNRSNLRAPWIDHILFRSSELATATLHEFWITLAKNDITYLPALARLLDSAQGLDVLTPNILPLLKHWQSCREQELRQLLLLSLQMNTTEQLLAISKTAVLDAENMPVKKQVYWLTTAFMLAPLEYSAQLAEFCGQTRMKILPLLDFINEIISNPDTAVALKADAIAQLIRIIAPAFRRNHDRQDQTDAISEKIMWLFEQLERIPKIEAISTVKKLKRVRVLKNYGDVLEKIEKSLHQT